jgi:uncharacterized HAD superfamily protein
MNGVKVGIDLDGTLVEYQEAVVKFLNAEYSTKYRISNVKRDDCYDILGANPVSRAFKLKEFYKFSHSLSKISPTNGAKKTILSLKKEGYELYVVTSRFIGFSSGTRKWLYKNFGKKAFTKIMFSKVLSSYSSKFKVFKYRRLGVSIVIEDSPYVAERCAHMGIKVLLIDKPWNKGLKLEGVKRVADLREALRILKD